MLFFPCAESICLSIHPSIYLYLYQFNFQSICYYSIYDLIDRVGYHLADAIQHLVHRFVFPFVSNCLEEFFVQVQKVTSVRELCKMRKYITVQYNKIQRLLERADIDLSTYLSIYLSTYQIYLTINLTKHATGSADSEMYRKKQLEL